MSLSTWQVFALAWVSLVLGCAQDGSSDRDGASGPDIPVFYLTALTVQDEAPHVIFQGWLGTGRLDEYLAARLTVHLDLDTMQADLAAFESYDGWEAAAAADAIPPFDRLEWPDFASLLFREFDALLPARVRSDSAPWHPDTSGAGVIDLQSRLARRAALYLPYTTGPGWYTTPEIHILLDCRGDACQPYEIYLAWVDLPLQVGVAVQVRKRALGMGPPQAREYANFAPEFKDECAGWTIKPLDDWDSFEPCDWYELLVNQTYYPDNPS